MSGVKRRTAYRKAVADAVSDTYPVPTKDERVVQVLRSHGSNLLEVTTASGDVGICMMPTKYRKLIWVSRGDYLIASEASADVETADGSSGTVRFFVEHILREPQIGVLQMKGLWPEAFKSVSVSKKALDEAQRECSHEHRAATAAAERDAATALALAEESADAEAPSAAAAASATDAAVTAAASAAAAASSAAVSTTALEGLSAGAGKQLVSSDAYDEMLGMGPGRNRRGRRVEESESESESGEEDLSDDE